MSCQKCGSLRIVSINAKCSDCCSVYQKDTDQDYQGYVPHEIGIGGGDYIEFDYCLECGQIQGMFPKGSLKGRDE